MASWFKKHFSCIKREPSVIVTSGGSTTSSTSNRKKNGNLLLKSEVDTVDAIQHQRLEKIILKNDLTRRNSNSLNKKNSNEYRDYSKNAESQYIAENYFKMRNNSLKQNNNNNNNLGKKIKIDPNDNQSRTISKPRELPRVIREYNNNMNLQELMKKLRACNECVSQKRICKCF